jgi:shikimate kinase
MSPPSEHAKHLVLIGLMGTGKTTAGTRAAAVLDRPFVDSDEQIEARTGRTVRDIFESEGEGVFRQYESEALLEALASDQPAVIAAAGGAVLRPENRAAIRDAARVVWLRADPEVLLERVGSGEHRPLLRDDPLGVLRKMEEERHHLYEDLSDVAIDVGKLPVDEVVELVVAAA